MFKITQVSVRACEEKIRFTRLFNASQSIQITSELLFDALNYIRGSVTTPGDCSVEDNRFCQAVELFVKGDFDGVDNLFPKDKYANITYLKIIHKAVSSIDGLFEILNFDSFLGNLSVETRKELRILVKRLSVESAGEINYLNQPSLKGNGERSIESLIEFLKESVSKTADQHLEAALVELMVLLTDEEQNEKYHRLLDETIKFNFEHIFYVSRKTDLHEENDIEESFHRLVNHSYSMCCYTGI